MARGARDGPGRAVGLRPCLGGVCWRLTRGFSSTRAGATTRPGSAGVSLAGLSATGASLAAPRSPETPAGAEAPRVSSASMAALLARAVGSGARSAAAELHRRWMGRPQAVMTGSTLGRRRVAPARRSSWAGRFQRCVRGAEQAASLCSCSDLVPPRRLRRSARRAGRDVLRSPRARPDRDRRQTDTARPGPSPTLAR